MKDNDFWTARPELEHIRDVAHARMVAPYAVLGAVLRHAIAATEPHVVLPATICSRASVNLFIALTGGPGAGKDGSNGTAYEAVHFVDKTTKADLSCPAPAPGSGAGLSRIFKGRKDEPGVTRADVVFTEISALQAIVERQGNDLEGTLLSAYMGQPIGSSNNSRETTTSMGWHTYRLCFSVGVQPEFARFFTSRVGSGLPQRFLWLPTTDPTIPFTLQTPRHDRLIVEVPSSLTNLASTGGDDLRDINIPPAAAQRTRELRHRRAVGAPDADPMASHANLTRLKVGFGFAVLNGRGFIDDTDWQLAGHMMGVSEHTLATVLDAAAQRRRRDVRQRAEDRAEADEVVQARAEQKSRDDAWKHCYQMLRKGDVVTRRQMQTTVTQRIREYIPGVLLAKVTEGIIVEVDSTDGRQKDAYQLKRRPK